MTIANDPRHCPTIVRAIVKDGFFYQMEYKDQTNSLVYILMKLYRLGMDNQQLNEVYFQLTSTMDALIMPKTSKLPNQIQENEWQDYLGDSDLYSVYLEFFHRQILLRGVDNVMNHYFYQSPLSQSIGSHRLPVIHLALGMQYKLEEIIGQALAYLVVSYQDASFLQNQPIELRNSGYLTAHQILVDQVRVDPRFASFHVSTIINTDLDCQLPENNKVTCKKVLQNCKELLRTYVYLWKMPADADEALQELAVLAAHMMMKPVRQGIRKRYVDLGTGGVLLNTINAIHVLYPNNSCPANIVLVQFLNLICYYIVQGRPKILSYSYHSVHRRNKQLSLYTVMDRSTKTTDLDVKKITAFLVLQEAQNQSTHPIYHKVMALL